MKEVKTMTKNETNKISFKLNNSSNELKQFIKNLLLTAIISLIGAIISCSVFFLFLSVFIFNLEIQKFNSDFTKIESKTIINQVDTLSNNIKYYFFEN
jgi:putative flippase GtrA